MNKNDIIAHIEKSNLSEKYKLQVVQIIENSALSEDDKNEMRKAVETKNYNSLLQRLFYIVNLSKNLIDLFSDDDS